MDWNNYINIISAIVFITFNIQVVFHGVPGFALNFTSQTRFVNRPQWFIELNILYYLYVEKSVLLTLKQNIQKMHQ